MKTAEKLFDKWSTGCHHVQAIAMLEFKQALTEHDKEIIALIDDMMSELWGQGNKPKLEEENIKPINILTELKNKIK